jgi:hypothetical protein
MEGTGHVLATLTSVRAPSGANHPNQVLTAVRRPARAADLSADATTTDPATSTSAGVSAPTDNRTGFRIDHIHNSSVHVHTVLYVPLLNYY